MEALKEYLAGVDTPAGLAVDGLTILEDVGDDEGGSFSTTLNRQLRWLSDPRMQRHLQAGDFSLVKALRENWSVYVCLPPAQIKRMKRWLRAMVRIALDAKMDTLKPPEGERTLFILDEFYSLGHMQLIEDAAAYMAGYGIKLVPVIQNIGQVQKLYEKNWETFLGNAGAIIAWGLNDLESEKYISDRMGNVLTWEVSESLGTSRKPMQFEVESISKNKSAALHERPVRRPNEVHEDGSRETLRAFIIPASTKPFMVSRVDYMNSNGTGLFDAPDSIEQWESQHGANT
ncbi:MAG: type IV secretory system conjugative DNA transfer family protein [Ascidiaceihabitans sp.]|uniref:type IV secretory system conjugative DNA transfer family protein n=1 Tax=Rhodobacterales TaxID=204455 RepID=UPI0032977CC0